MADEIPPLGRLTRMDPRAIWGSEAGHFTPWFAQGDNLRLLGEAVGLEIELEAQEQNVGPFRTAADDEPETALCLWGCPGRSEIAAISMPWVCQSGEFGLLGGGHSVSSQPLGVGPGVAKAEILAK